ncbi:histidine kinase [Streptomyces sp. NBC_01016]|uniref:sensor histidine kinase n=1 Tax=Streptomyces sp. NBC_01016 TaxID=2903720 RepID=UPI00225844C8|nr:histidine kinase [Streptomyces sp. NBC_01016]MCX4834598.1 histidine kinase [Streptomyces sp. NBC_01016]
MMRTTPIGLGRRRALWCGLTLVLLGLPAFLGPPMALLLALVAVATVLAALVPWPLGPVTLVRAGYVVAVLSLAVDLGYRGQQGLTLLWMPFEFAALLVLTARLVRREPRPVLPGATLAIAALVLPLRFTVRNPESGTNGSLLMLVLTLVPVLCAVGIGMRLRTTDTRSRLAVLEARRDQRLHMARVLHDFVAHELTGMVLEVQAARTSAYDPGEYDAFLARLEESGLRALDQMDRTLDTLRQAEQLPAHGGAADEPAEAPTRVHGLVDLPDLTERFSASTSIPTELDLDETLVGTLRREIDETAYTLVLEALTNVRRHAAGATSVRVSVRRDAEDRLCVKVIDNGGQSSPLTGDRDGGGTGLAGLDERFALLGGGLEAGPDGTGWQVTGILPLLQRLDDTG